MSGRISPQSLHVCIKGTSESSNSPLGPASHDRMVTAEPSPEDSERFGFAQNSNDRLALDQR
jgi:hypothetical protein